MTNVCYSNRVFSAESWQSAEAILYIMAKVKVAKKNFANSSQLKFSIFFHDFGPFHLL